MNMTETEFLIQIGKVLTTHNNLKDYDEMNSLMDTPLPKTGSPNFNGFLIDCY